jgi:hypothetical protein
VKPTVVRLAAALLVVSLAGCGAHDRAAPSSQAPDPQRIEDLVPLTRAQAAHAAKRIALVRSLGSRVVEAAPGTPFTRTRFAVEDVLKGRLPREFVVQVIGGRLGDTVVESPVPAFAPSRRYVLFLGPDGPAGPTIFPQAVIEVTSDPTGLLASIRSHVR